MLKFLADENFNGKILRGLLRCSPNLDIVRVQDTKISGADDPVVLAWAAKEERILLTHDVNTITKYVYERVVAGKPMPGVFELKQSIAIGVVIEEILVLAEASFVGEWEGQVQYLPL